MLRCDISEAELIRLAIDQILEDPPVATRKPQTGIFASSEPSVAHRVDDLLAEGIRRVTLICDTSGLLAALDKNEEMHDRCAAVLGDHTNLVVSSLVLAELDYLVRRRVGIKALQPFYDDIEEGVYELGLVNNATIARAREIDIQYARLGIGLTDAVNIVLASDYKTSEILTLNEHYRAFSPLTRHVAFKLSPHDD